MKWCSLSMLISFVLKTILSDINITTEVFFLLVLAWCMFSFFYFKSVCVFIFKVLSCKQHIIESFIKSDICLLIGYWEHLPLIWWLIQIDFNLSSFYLLFVCFICCVFSFSAFLWLTLFYNSTFSPELA